MAEARAYHVSGAVLAVKPDSVDGVLSEIAAFDNVEVHGCDRGKIVVVIDGPSTGVLGETLMRLSVLHGVIAANMVFEQVDMEEDERHGQRTDAA